MFQFGARPAAPPTFGAVPSPSAVATAPSFAAASPAPAPPSAATFGFSRIFQGDNDIFTDTDIATAALGQLALDAHVPGRRLPPLWPMIANAANHGDCSATWVRSVTERFDGRVTTLDLTRTTNEDMHVVWEHPLCLFNLTTLVTSAFPSGDIIMPRLETLDCGYWVQIVSGFERLRVLRGGALHLSVDPDNEQQPAPTWPDLEQTRFIVENMPSLRHLLRTSPRLTAISLQCGRSVFREVIDAFLDVAALLNQLQGFGFTSPSSMTFGGGFFGGFGAPPPPPPPPSDTGAELAALGTFLRLTPRLVRLGLSGNEPLTLEPVAEHAPQLQQLGIGLAVAPQLLRGIERLANLHTLVLDFTGPPRLVDQDNTSGAFADVDIPSFAKRLTRVRFSLDRNDKAHSAHLHHFVHAGLRNFEIDSEAPVSSLVVAALVQHRPALLTLALRGNYAAAAEEASSPNFDQLLEAVGANVHTLWLTLAESRKSCLALWTAVGARCAKLRCFQTGVLCDGTAQIEDLLRGCRRIETIMCPVAWCTPIMQQTFARLTARRNLRIYAYSSRGGFGYGSQGGSLFAGGKTLPVHSEASWTWLSAF